MMIECKICKYSQPIKGFDERLECRYNPPVLRGDFSKSSFPMISPKDSCGKGIFDATLKRHPSVIFKEAIEKISLVNPKIYENGDNTWVDVAYFNTVKAIAKDAVNE